MAPLRPFALFRMRDQWLRAAHAHTAIDPETGGVQLSRLPDAARPVSAGPPPDLGAGLALDAACRLYHSLPDEGGVERILWAARDPLGVSPVPSEPIDLFELAAAAMVGDFRSEGSARGPLREPRGLAVDDEDRLFVAETGTGRVLIFDLFSRRLLRRADVRTVGAPLTAPIDLAAGGRTVWVLTRPFGLLRMGARTGPRVVHVDGLEGSIPAGSVIRRVAVSAAGDIALLARDAGGRGAVVSLRWTERTDPHGRIDRGLMAERVTEVPDATDLEFQAPGQLVVAGGPGQDFLRWRDAIEDEPLKAKGYDGLGIVRTPDHRIGFWTDRGFRHAVPGRVHFAGTGRVTTYALDAGTFQMPWGRLFLDACIPDGTEVRVHFTTSDELPDEPTLPRTAPENAAGVDVPRPELSPPLIPLSMAPEADAPGHPVHRRAEGREIPWSRPDPDDPFVTFDLPVQAPPGRYLWIALDLRSSGRTTPRVKCLRVERPGHDLLRRLPRVYSRDEASASFLQRYLAMVDGVLTGLEDRAAERRALIDPMSAPAELLPWLADFVGLVLDERWPVARRRALIAEAACLFRSRGTVPGLLRFLELCLGTTPVIIEQFRVRGLGGAVLREAGSPAVSSPILGGGFRVGGTVGDASTAEGPGAISADAFATNAHRFSVVIPAVLTDDQLAATTHLLDVHRPAHTLFDICTVGAGMRVGSGLHVGLSSTLGRTGGWETLQLGASFLGTTGVVGRSGPGVVPGATVLGGDSRVG